jgi:flagella basal body P-ring formation protein FlgA
MTFRTLFLATALLALASPVRAETLDDSLKPPTLRAHVSVANDVVRIGDLVDNAGVAAQIAVYRAPDLGTTGTIATAQVLSVLRAHDVIGVATDDIKQVAVTRLARNIAAKDIQLAVAQAIAHRGGLGGAQSLSLTFDRDLQDLHLDASNTGELQPVAVHVDPRSGRFDVTLDIENSASSAPTALRYTGAAVEMVEATVLARNVERTQLLKAADVVVERLPKAQVGSDPAQRDQALGMQMRHSMRAGQPLHVADLTKPNLVTRDQAVTVVYQTAGIYLTTRGKAVDSGTEGDVVSVVNPESKRTVTGVVTGRGQVTVQVATPRPVYIADTAAIPSNDPTQTPVAVADGNPVQPVTAKPE